VAQAKITKLKKKKKEKKEKKVVTFGRLRQEDCEFKVSLGKTVKLYLRKQVDKQNKQVKLQGRKAQLKCGATYYH
jgi:hypothetical protein